MRIGCERPAAYRRIRRTGCPANRLQGLYRGPHLAWRAIRRRGWPGLGDIRGYLSEARNGIRLPLPSKTGRPASSRRSCQRSRSRFAGISFSQTTHSPRTGEPAAGYRCSNLRYRYTTWTESCSPSSGTVYGWIRLRCGISPARRAHLRGPGRPELVVDLSGVGFAGSAALGNFVALQRIIRQHGGRIVFCHVEATVSEVFRASRLESLFGFETDRDAALRSVRDRPGPDPFEKDAPAPRRSPRPREWVWAPGCVAAPQVPSRPEISDSGRSQVSRRGPPNSRLCA